MNRQQLIREFWEAKIPVDATEMGITDAARFINRGLKRAFQSRRTLQRRAESGRLLAIGGQGTGHHGYRIFRADLIDYLCSLDRISAPLAVQIAEFKATPEGPTTPAPAVARKAPPRRRDPDPDQGTLLLPGIL